MSGSDWREIGVLIARMVVKQPPFVEIVICLGVAFFALMILEGLRASFVPRRAEHQPDRAERRSSRREGSAPARNAMANAVKPPPNPKRSTNTVKPHSPPRPIIRRDMSAPPEAPDESNLPQTASFGD